MTADALVAALERRIDALESAQAIEALHADYVRAVADRDVQRVMQAFADDAEADLRGHGLTRGKAEIERLLARVGGPEAPRAGYVLSSPDIVVEGDRARGTWTWHRLFCEFPTATGMLRVWGPWYEGRYRCEYLREDGRWKFARVHFRVVLPDADAQPPSPSTAPESP